MILGCKKRASGLFVGLLLCFVIGGAPSPAAAQTSSYAQMSRVAIGRIVEAVDLISAGKTSQAEALLGQSKDSLGLLVGQTQRFRAIAINEHQRCVQSQGEFERRVNDLYARRQDEAGKIDALNAQLAQASKRQELTRAEVARLTRELSDTAASLKQSQAKLRELERWWWVPGYGAFLGIRTLVDNDIQNQGRALRELQAQRLQMQKNVADINSTQAVIGNLVSNTKLTDRVIQDLRAMEASDQAKLVELKRVGVFLTDADVFWGKAYNSLDVSGGSFINSMEILHGKLAEEGGGTAFSSSGSQSVVNFRQALMAFADSVDRNSNFLLRPSTEYCGGPPRLNGIQPQRCDIAAITQYYEIVDAKTCTFRYINPPGCPGNPRVVPPAPADVLSSRAHVNWIAVAD